MMRRRLGGEPHAALASLPDDSDAARRRHVREMKTTMGELAQCQIASNHHFFGNPGPAFKSETSGYRSFVHDPARRKFEVLLVDHDRSVDQPTIFESVAHNSTVEDRSAV